MAKKNGKKKNIWELIGVWAFIIGIVVALIISLISPAGISVSLGTLLAVLGLIVGLLNIGDNEVVLYLLASVTFILSAWAVWSLIVVPFLKTFMSAIIMFVAPGAMIVSFKALYRVAKD